MTEPQIEAEIKALSASLKVPSKNTITKIQKNRSAICAAYGALDVGGALQSVFGQFPLDLELTFETPTIVGNWPLLQQEFKVPALPPRITQASAAAQLMGRHIVASVLNEVIKLAATLGLSVASAGC